MLGISPLGWIHTLGSLPALPLALSMLWHHRRIDPRSTAGKAYFVFMLVGALTVFPLAHGGMSTGIAAVTLLLLFVGFGVRIRPTASRAALYVETIALSLTVFLLLLPTVSETLRRLPPSNPIATTLDAPILRVANLALLLGLIIGLIVQVSTLRRSRAPVSMSTTTCR
jgi:hypothetical protein